VRDGACRAAARAPTGARASPATLIGKCGPDSWQNVCDLYGKQAHGQLAHATFPSGDRSQRITRFGGASRDPEALERDLQKVLVTAATAIRYRAHTATAK